MIRKLRQVGLLRSYPVSIPSNFGQIDSLENGGK